MRLRFWRHSDAGVTDAERDSEAASEQLRQVQDNWARTRDDSRWAKTTRERNHLTALFYDGLSEGNS